MKPMHLIDAECRVKQAERVLAIWLESGLFGAESADMIGALVTLLDGVHDSIEHFRVSGEGSL